METTGIDSKPGKHGTLHRFYLVYHDPVDAGFGKQVMTMLGYDAEDVKNKFYDDDFNSGWEVIKIYRHRA